MTIYLWKQLKENLSTVHYRDYKYFCNDSFTELLQIAISQNSGIGYIYERFAASCNKILDNHSPLKKKYVRGTHLPFMNKSSTEEKTEEPFLKNRSKKNKINYKKETCVLHFWVKVEENIIKTCV